MGAYYGSMMSPWSCMASMIVSPAVMSRCLDYTTRLAKGNYTTDVPGTYQSHHFMFRVPLQGSYSGSLRCGFRHYLSVIVAEIIVVYKTPLPIVSCVICNAIRVRFPRYRPRLSPRRTSDGVILVVYKYSKYSSKYIEIQSKFFRNHLGNIAQLYWYLWPVV